MIQEGDSYRDGGSWDAGTNECLGLGEVNCASKFFGENYLL